MKRLIFSVLCTVFLLLSSFTQAQTNAFTYASDWDQNLYSTNSSGARVVTGKHIKLTFTMDSLGVVLLSKVIDLSEFAGNDFGAYPITFRFKTVSTYDSSKTRIRLLGCFQSVTDTALAIDTIRHWGGGDATTADQVETDSTGTLTLNSKFVSQVRIAVECLRADVNTGYLDLYIRKQE